MSLSWAPPLSPVGEPNLEKALAERLALFLYLSFLVSECGLDQLEYGAFRTSAYDKQKRHAQGVTLFSITID
ncbi:hypothetical protein BZJ19_01795 [Salinivibrio proteolyticus]|nr:hypothetical protein BZJ19_01795 [Salinivibrio proteolyticus]